MQISFALYLSQCLGYLVSKRTLPEAGETYLMLLLLITSVPVLVPTLILLVPPHAVATEPHTPFECISRDSPLAEHFEQRSKSPIDNRIFMFISIPSQ